MLNMLCLFHTFKTKHSIIIAIFLKAAELNKFLRVLLTSEIEFLLLKHKKIIYKSIKKNLSLKNVLFISN